MGNLKTFVLHWRTHKNYESQQHVQWQMYPMAKLIWRSLTVTSISYSSLATNQSWQRSHRQQVGVWLSVVVVGKVGGAEWESSGGRGQKLIGYGVRCTTVVGGGVLSPSISYYWRSLQITHTAVPCKSSYWLIQLATLLSYYNRFKALLLLNRVTCWLDCNYITIFGFLS